VFPLPGFFDRDGCRAGVRVQAVLWFSGTFFNDHINEKLSDLKVKNVENS